MDLMDDEDLKKSVIDKMMGELDDVTSDSLKRKPEAGPVKGVEIAITVSPKSGEEMPKDYDGDADDCMDPNCEDPMHDHAAKGDEPEDDYIGQMIKKLG